MSDVQVRCGSGAGAPEIRGAAPFRIRVRHVPGLPVVALRLLLPGGSRIERVPGLAWVTGRMLSEGTVDTSWREIADACEALGMALGSFGSLEAHGLGIDCLSRDCERALEWLSRLALVSSFPQERCQWLGRQGRAELESLRDQPEALTAWAFAEQIYAPHPAGRPLPGSEAGLARIDGSACESFHRQALRRGGIVAIAGDVEEASVRSFAEGLFRGSERRARAGGPRPGEEPPPIAGTGSLRRRLVTPARDQAYLYAGHLTVSVDHPDLAALEVGSVILGSGAGLTGRIPERVREREGLAYSASASAVAAAGLDPGRLCIAVGTSPETLPRAETCVREELARLLDGGPTGDELETARTYLVRRLSFQRETARQWAGLLARAALHDLPLDDEGWWRQRYQELDCDRVTSALRRHLHPDRLAVTLGLPRS